VATFIGSPAMNLMPGRVVGSGMVETSGGRIAFDPVLFDVGDGQPVEVGIRPEDLQFATAGNGGLSFATAFVEELGATRLVHGTSGSAPLVVAVAAAATPHGSDASLAAVAGAVHLFDRASGKSLRREIRGTSS
jgi:sn-glycerol 3-phosphate transport system ATP-binding protein